MFPVADAHCDYLYGAMEYGWNIQTCSTGQTITLNHLKKGNVKLQFFAAWTDLKLDVPPLEQVLLMVDRYHDMVDGESSMERFSKEYCCSSEKIATLLTLEGAECLEESPSILRDLYRLGVRAATLTWNSNNELAGAAMAKRQKGLSKVGKEIVHEMNKIGMALDVAHLSDAGISDALEISNSPIFASHSNCRALCNVPRALTDEQIKRIAERGGVIGINYYGPQLVRSGIASISDIVDHILHVIKIAGISAVCLGSDFDGMMRYPLDLPHPGKLQDLCNALQNAGLTESETKRVTYRNLRDFIVQFV